MPYKLGFTMTLAFRLVPVFLDAAVTVVQAQRCRGFNFDEGNLVQRARRYVPVIVPVFMGALRRADGMAMALEARGFQSGRDAHGLRALPLSGSATAAALAGRGGRRGRAISCCGTTATRRCRERKPRHRRARWLS